MIALASLLLSMAAAPAAPASADTVHLRVGSPEIDGRVFPVHLARNRVYIDGGTTVNTWTNELTVGDSAGIPVMRWVTRGVQIGPEGAGATWELHQTYNARTLAPLTYYRTGSTGPTTRLSIDGTRVRGVQQLPGSPPTTIDRTIDQPGFFAGASDLIPMAFGLQKDAIMTAPFWSPGMQGTEMRVFHVIDEVPVSVEGAEVRAWKVEERHQETGRLIATWWLTNSSPYMVLGEVNLQDGRVQRITGVDLPMR